MRSWPSLDDVDGVGQVTSNLSASLPYVAVTVDRDAAAELGLSEVAVGALVSNTMQPRSIGSVEIDETAADGVPRGLRAAGDDRRAAAAHDPERRRPHPARADRDRRADRGPDLDHVASAGSAPPPSP